MAMGVFATFTIVNAPSDVGLEVEDDGKTLDKNSSKGEKETCHSIISVLLGSVFKIATFPLFF